MRHSIFSRFTFVVAIMVSVLFGVHGARAQAPHGINSDGRDFFLGMMPGIPPDQGWMIRGASYYLIGSYQDNNQVTISNFDPVTGKELTASTHIISKGMCLSYAINGNGTPSRPGEMLEWKAVHVHSRYPVSVQYYSDGSSSGGMFQAIPTAALGKSYVVAAWYDNPLKDAPNQSNPDSSSSEFEIIAPYDNTTVTLTPNSTTYAGVVGMNTGAGSNGTPHPVTITMQRGQIYWVRSQPTENSNDLSGSTIISNKPVAVLGGAERALIGDPTGFFDEDILDEAVEQMPPVEDWGSDYPAIPTMPASNSGVNVGGDGDLYRLYSNDAKGIQMDMWQWFSPSQRYGPEPVSLYQAPPQSFENITEPIDLLVDTLSKDANGNLKKMYAVQYQYFQGVPSNEESDRSPNEMNLIPIDRYRLSTVFMVPKNSIYHGYQFINVITNKDSVRKIFISRDNGSSAALISYNPKKQYQIPLHPELVGLTFQLSSASYVITGNTPFACYSYGRTEPYTKDVWGYAAPTGQAYGSHSENNPPRAEITPSCDHWDVFLHDDRPSDEGIADVTLLEDPSGFITRPAYVSYNCRLNPTDPTIPPFTPGDKSLSFSVQIADLTQDAFAAIYVVDRAGNDTVIQLHYTGQTKTIVLSQTSVQFPSVHVGAEVCSTFTLHIGATGSSDRIVVQPANFVGLDLAKSFSYTSVPGLPASLKAGDSVVFTVCFASNDTNVHRDSLLFAVGCLNDGLLVTGVAQTPIIIADDHDFQAVPVGDTVCALVRVRNVGNAPLILDTSWVLHLNPEFYFTGAGILPDTLLPGNSTLLNFCFHPTVVGPSDTRMDWGTNLIGNFQHLNKDTSLLLGSGTKPGLNWDRARQPFTVECEAYDTVRVYLNNTSKGTGGADITVTNIGIIGPDASEFQVVGYETRYAPPWQLLESTSQWVNIQFKADLSKGYGNRNAQVFAYGEDKAGKYDTTIFSCTGIIRHAIVSITPSPYNYGVQKPGVQLTQTFTITNTGDTNFVYTGITLTGLDFSIVSGPKVGDTLAPGASATIVIQFTAPQNGGLSNGTLVLASAHSLCEGTMVSFQANSGSVKITASGHDFPLNYVCHTDASIVSATVSGKYGLILDSVQITNGPGAPDADQFVFADDSTQLKAKLFQGVINGTVSFPVRFTPTRNGPDTALALFYVHDTADNIYRVYTAYITGTGYAAANTLSLRNPATSDGSYTAVTAGVVTLPVRLAVPFDSVAQVYGIQFSIRYYRDAFQYLTVTPAAGISLVNNPTPITTSDPKYDSLPIHVTSNSPITNLSTVANVTWQYLVAKDSISSFQIKDLMFLGQSGAQVCWVSQGTIPATFYGQNICGDNTLRQYLKGGIPTFSIERIVPNPMTKSANVDFLVSQDGVPVTMEIYNALGQKVQTLLKDDPHAKGGYQVTLDASGMPSGLYTVFISTPGYGASKQIVVSK